MKSITFIVSAQLNLYILIAIIIRIKKMSDKNLSLTKFKKRYQFDTSHHNHLAGRLFIRSTSRNKMFL